MTGDTGPAVGVVDDEVGRLRKEVAALTKQRDRCGQELAVARERVRNLEAELREVETSFASRLEAVVLAVCGVSKRSHTG
jgi:prefoldin subunit 5